jgi:hypothetical protein
MELKVNEIIIPEHIEFNYEELKKELTQKVETYKNLIYTEDEIKQAKSDKANLNKLKKALNDERIRREKEYMQPFNDFKKKINEIISIIDEPISVIDMQVKDFDLKRKEEKKEKIKAIFEAIENRSDWLTLEMIFDDRWLLSSTSLKSVEDNINGWINRINTELSTLQQLKEYSFEAIEEYKRSLDINRAIAEGQRLADIQKRKQEIQQKIEAQKEAETVEAPKEIETVKSNNEEAQWINFSAKLTVSQAKELKCFFDSRCIEFKAI